MSEIRVERDKDSPLLNCEFPHDHIIGATQTDIECSHDVVSRLRQANAVRRRKIFVEKQFHPLASTSSSEANCEA